MKVTRALLVLLGIVVVFGCAKPIPEGVLSVDANKTFELSVNGRRRGGSLFVPLVYDGTRAHSLVFALHGAGTTPDLFRKTVLMDQMAEEHDMIIVYPEGIGRRWDRAEDIDLFATMIDLFCEKYSIEPGRVYATGLSAGAIRAYELAAALPGRFAAIAPVAGCMRADADTTNLSPTSVLHIHGKKDDEVLFEGIPDWNLVSAEDSVGIWKRTIGASGTGDEFFRSRDAVGLRWESNGYTVATVFDEENGHYWPPYASELILDFFYTNPSRPARVTIDRGGLPLTCGVGTVIPLRCTIDRAAETSPVEEVTWYTNGSKAAVSTEAPWNTEWAVNLAGVRRLTATVRLADGSEIRSTRNPFMLVSASLSKDADTAGAEVLLPVVDTWSTKIEDGSLEAKNAVDSDLFTRWGSDWTDDESLSLDLGAVRTVSALTLYWEMAYAKEYCVETSTDKETWTIAAQKSDGLGNIEFLSFPPTEARYLRIRGIRRATEWGYSLFEVFVYGKK